MKNQKENKPTGRPTKYKKEFAELAYNYCLLGATDAQLGEFFEVNEFTINRWKKDHPVFCESLKRGKLMADANVAQSLYKRATGYSHAETHISNYQGEITKTEITKHYPPDTTACIFWLKNRRPQNWRDKIEVKADVKMDKEMMDRVSTEMVERLAKARERQKQVLIERGITDERH